MSVLFPGKKGDGSIPLQFERMWGKSHGSRCSILCLSPILHIYLPWVGIERGQWKANHKLGKCDVSSAFAFAAALCKSQCRLFDVHHHLSSQRPHDELQVLSVLGG